MPAPRFSIAVAIATATFALAGAAAAQSPTPAPAPTLAPAPALAPEAVDETTVVARVGDQELTLGDLMRMRSQLPAQYQQVPFEAIYEPMLNRAIDTMLVNAAAKSSGVGERDDVKAKIKEATEQVLAEAYLTSTIGEQVTEDALRERYEAQIAGQGGGEEAKARHILLESEDDARAVIAELDGGADFAKLAEQKSTGPSAAQGGDLGWFKAEQMVPEFSTAAFALEPGTYTKDPVQSQFGWHVILLEEKRVADAPPFEQMQQQLASDMTRELIQQRLADLRSAATIERFGPTGNPLPTPK